MTPKSQVKDELLRLANDVKTFAYGCLPKVRIGRSDNRGLLLAVFLGCMHQSLHAFIVLLENNLVVEASAVARRMALLLLHGRVCHRGADGSADLLRAHLVEAREDLRLMAGLAASYAENLRDMLSGDAAAQLNRALSLLEAKADELNASLADDDIERTCCGVYRWLRVNYCHIGPEMVGEYVTMQDDRIKSIRLKHSGAPAPLLAATLGLTLAFLGFALEHLQVPQRAELAAFEKRLDAFDFVLEKLGPAKLAF